MAFGRNKKMAERNSDYARVLGDGLSFGAAEAYRLLRTNLNFSLPDTVGCKIIGLTSTLRGEGKSTTSVNLAFTMAQTGQRVLLMECDLRLPTAPKRLSLEASPGLSNLLTGQCTMEEAIQSCSLNKDLFVLTAGDVPPNPAELLNSEQMTSTVHTLSEQFDIIIVDLPPVSAVSDALIMSRLLAGMIVVVREGVCSRGELADTIRTLRFTDCKLLGFVMTNAGQRDKKYGYYKYGYYKYGYYRRRSKNYYADSYYGSPKKKSAGEGDKK